MKLDSTRIANTCQNQNYSLDIKKRILEKRRLRRNWQLSRLSENKLALIETAMKLRVLLNKIDNDTLTHKLESLSLSNSSEYSLWKVIKNTRTPPMIKTHKIQWQQMSSQWNRESAGLCPISAESLYSTENRGSNNKRVKEFLNSDLQLSSPLKLISSKEIQAVIKRLLPKKASGFDLHNFRSPKTTTKKELAFLVFLFNGIIRTLYFPDTWKVSQIIMI